MGRARARIDLPVQVSAAEELWYDLAPLAGVRRRLRRTSAKLEGDWPRDGAR